MTDKYKKLFLSPEGDAGGGDKGAAVFEPEEGEQQQGEEQQQAPPQATVNAEALAQSFGAVLKEHFKPAATQTTPEKRVDELSQEELEKLTEAFPITDDWIKRFDNLETRPQALKELQRGLVKQSDNFARRRLKEFRDELEPQLQQATRVISEMHERQLTERFHNRYPDLSNPALEPVIQTITTELHRSGKKYTKETELFDDIAKNVESVIKVHNPNFKLSAAGSTPAAKTQQRARSGGGLPVTTPGSGGGSAAGATSTQPNKPRGLAIFDK